MSTTNEEYIMQILNSLKKMDYIKPEEIPNIDLYMDQVTTFMDEHLESSKRYPEDKLLTKTMINNYTKNKLLPPPVKKKYNKEHMLMLVFIYYFKNILSISDIQTIFQPLTEQFYNRKDGLSLEDIYEEVFSSEKADMELLAKDIVRKYNKAKGTFSQAEAGEDKEFLQTFSFISMLAFDITVKKMMIEKLIDKSVSGISGKPKSGKKEEKPDKEEI